MAISLPTGWSDDLANPAGCRPKLSIEIDPDDRDIEPTGIHDIHKIRSIITGVDTPDPDFMDELELKDITVGLNNPDEYFNAFTSRAGPNPFRRIFRILDEATTSNPVDLRPGAFNFMVGDVAYFTDGTNLESASLNSAAANSIGWSGSLSNTYNAGDLVATIPVTGNIVNVILGIDGEAATERVFRGRVREPFETADQTAMIKIDNFITDVLKQELTIKATSDSPTERSNASGTLATTLAWTYAGNGNDDGSCSGVTVYTGASLGQWTVTFSDATNFTVTGPNCKDKAGTTGSNFFDQTDATDSQIQIPSANWGGTKGDDDVLTFYICANYETKTVPEIVYGLLNVYGGIAEANIDVISGGDVTDNSTSGWADYSFNLAYNKVNGETMTISFYKSMSVAEAILQVLPHALGYLGQMLDGKLRILLLHPLFYFDTYTDVDFIGHPKISSTDIVNEIIINYGWDYENEVYQYSFIYPTIDSENTSFKLHGKKVTKTIYLPGFYTEANAEFYAERYYSVWKNGLILAETVSPLTAIEAEFGNKINLDGGNPDMNLDDFLIYKIEKQLGAKNRVKIFSLKAGFMQDEDDVWSSSSSSSSWSSESSSHSSTSASESDSDSASASASESDSESASASESVSASVSSCSSSQSSESAAIISSTSSSIASEQ